MKTMKLFRLFSITAIVAVGLVFSLSNCKREKEIVVVNVHDSLKGKDISGLVTYPNYSNVVTNADGAVLSLYVGTSATGSPVAITYANVSGNYVFKYLLPGSYFITCTYNTSNLNNKGLQGVTFVSDPGYAVTMASGNLTQNVTLSANLPTGALKLALTADTLSAGAGFLPVSLESHSKVTFTGLHNMNQQDLQGGFNTIKMLKFNFDEANPANIVINCMVNTSSINTFEPSRDALTGCVTKTLNIDTTKAGTVISAIPATDTIRFYANAGQVVKYGKGYLAHGHMRGFYKHSYGNTRPSGSLIPADTNYLLTAEGFTYNNYIDKPVDMYFEYQFKKKQVKAATQTTPSSFNWEMVFDGTFTFNKAAWYVISTSISDIIKVDVHVAMQGDKNREY